MGRRGEWGLKLIGKSWRKEGLRSLGQNLNSTFHHNVTACLWNGKTSPPRPYHEEQSNKVKRRLDLAASFTKGL